MPERSPLPDRRKRRAELPHSGAGMWPGFPPPLTVSADMSPILIALIRAIAKSHVKIGTLLDVRGFGFILISVSS